MSPEDVAYVRAGFREFDELCRERGEDAASVRALIADGRLPQPSYVLDEGTEMVPPDYFALADEAGGAGRLHDAFVARVVAAGGEDPEGEWEAYLSGEYGVCLKRVAPETIVRKGALVDSISALLDRPEPADAVWRRDLRDLVDELDELERPFAAFDRERFGGPSSRDRLITAVRERYPQAFEVEVPA